MEAGEGSFLGAVVAMPKLLFLAMAPHLKDFPYQSRFNK